MKASGSNEVLVRILYGGAQARKSGSPAFSLTVRGGCLKQGVRFRIIRHFEA